MQGTGAGTCSRHGARERNVPSQKRAFTFCITKSQAVAAAAETSCPATPHLQADDIFTRPSVRLWPEQFNLRRSVPG